MKNLYFYNHGHYGDVFISRYMVRDVVEQLKKLGKYYNFQYALPEYTNQKVLRDLAIPLMSPAAGTELLSDHSYHLTRFKHSADMTNIYINAWVGMYRSLWHSNHPSYFYLHNIWKHCYAELSETYGIFVEWNPDPWYYVPDMDYCFYETKLVDDFLEAHPKTYLFCNGSVRSHQSSMDNMQAIIEHLATIYTDTTFLVTEYFPTTLPNIKFSNEVFKLDSDICELGYLSTKVNLIVGKNSGPFCYTNSRRNLLNPDKIFVCFSHQAVDALPYGLNNAADFRFSNTVYPYFATEILINAIEDERNRRQLSGFSIV